MKQIMVDITRCLACRTCEIRCAVERGSASLQLKAAFNEDSTPIPRVSVIKVGNGSLPVQCRHCEDAPCIAACPTSVMKRDVETGVVYVDEAECIGCFMCAMVCPFGAVTPELNYNIAVKCDQCIGMEEPVCVQSCPTGALILCDEQQPPVAWKRARLLSIIKNGE